MNTPKYIKKFVQALMKAQNNTIKLDFLPQPIFGHKGILTTSKIQYNKNKTIDLLNQNFEFTLNVEENNKLEISVQLYLNESEHYRLFCYCKRGLLFSINLTKLSQYNRKKLIPLEQTIMINSPRTLSCKERQKRRDILCSILRGKLGLDLKENGRINFGIFDSVAGKFLNTNAQTFIKDFIAAAILKGHFMSNKGYQVSGIQKMNKLINLSHEKTKYIYGRYIPPGLQYEVLRRDEFKCQACGRGVKDGVKLHIDHIKPFSQGGFTAKENLQTLCHIHNLGKSNKL